MLLCGQRPEWPLQLHGGSGENPKYNEIMAPIDSRQPYESHIRGKNNDGLNFSKNGVCAACPKLHTDLMDEILLPTFSCQSLMEFVWMMATVIFKAA